MLGIGEWIIILAIVLIIFGAGKLPQIGDALGRGIRNFRKASSGQNEIDVTPRGEVPPATPGAGSKAQPPSSGSGGSGSSGA
jgi:sec-independent protein translocase protein TatA